MKRTTKVLIILCLFSAFVGEVVVLSDGELIESTIRWTIKHFSGEQENSTFFFDGAEDWTHDTNCGSGHPWDSCVSSNGYVQSNDDEYVDPVNGSYFISMWDCDTWAECHLTQGVNQTECDVLKIVFQTNSGSGNDAGEGCLLHISNNSFVSYDELFDSETEGWLDSTWHYKEVDLTPFKTDEDLEVRLTGKPTFNKGASEWCDWDDVRILCETEVTTTTTTTTTLPSNTCEYDVGDWHITCSDGCNITSDVDLDGNDLYIWGDGEINFYANITNVGLFYTECRVFVLENNKIG